MAQRPGSQVMHDLHDQVVALTRMFRSRGHVRCVIDLQLASEALGGSACSSFAGALCAFGACSNPQR